MVRSFAFTLLALSAQAAWAQSEISLNANLSGSVRSLDSDFENVDHDVDAVNNASSVSLGASVKQSELTWFGLVEAGQKNDKAGIESIRQFYVGVDTAFGQFVAGKKSSEYRLTGEALDPFYDTSVTGFNGREAREGASYGLSNLTNGYSRNMVAYTSPALMGGLRLNGGVFVGTKDAPNDEMDYTAGAEYSMPAFGEGHQLSAGLQYLKIENPASFAAGIPARNGLVTVAGSPGLSDNYRVHGMYTAPRFSLGASFEHIDVETESEARGYLFLSGTYSVTTATVLAASYGRLDFSAGSPALSGDGYSLGVFHKLCDNLSAYLAARQVSLDAGDTTTAALGFTYNFTATARPSR